VREAERSPNAPQANRGADRDWNNRSRNERGKQPDGEHARGDRFRNDRSRNDRDRGNRYRDDHGIGEMNHPDNVVGFGDALPDFLARPVPLPKLIEKSDSPTEPEVSPPKRVAAPRKPAAAKKTAATPLATPESDPVVKKRAPRKRAPAKKSVLATEAVEQAPAEQTEVEKPSSDSDA
jgi:hypothetical protein